MDTRKTVSLYDAKTNLSALVDEAAAGVEITITKHGKALASLKSARQTMVSAPSTNTLKPRLLGGFADSAKPMSKREWLRQWKESDAYVAGLFSATNTKKKPKSKNSKVSARPVSSNSKKQKHAK
jgi:prevent-host-death family protein